MALDIPLTAVWHALCLGSHFCSSRWLAGTRCHLSQLVKKARVTVLQKRSWHFSLKINILPRRMWLIFKKLHNYEDEATLQFYKNEIYYIVSRGNALSMYYAILHSKLYTGKVLTLDMFICFEYHTHRTLSINLDYDLQLLITHKKCKQRNCRN